MGERIDVDVAIVGAGLAGLTVAAELADAGRAVLVLEARDRVGGRTLNQDIGDGAVVEMGGQWIGPTQDRIASVARRLGIDTFPTWVEGDELAYFGRRRHRYSGEMPRLNPLVLADLAQATTRLDRLARRVPLQRPWDAGRAGEWDGMTFATWLRRAVKTARAREILDLYLATILATETSNFSLLHALFYVHAGSGFQILSTLEGGAQQDRLVGGSQVVALRLAEQLGDAVRLQAPVRRVRHDGSTVRLEGDGVRVTARRAVIAIPPTLAARIDYDPQLPAARDQLTQRLPQGTVIKVNAVYDEPFWRADGLNGFAWGPGQPVRFALDNSPPDARAGVLVGFITGEAARRLGRVDARARRQAVLDSLRFYHGERAGRPQAYHEVDWSAEPWTRGCFGAHFPPGVWTQYGPALREPIGRLHWAGTETSPVWNGYMDGAVRSGERAAAEVLAALDETAETAERSPAVALPKAS
jgi:monoamine oxidase